jgi:short-subunit dehydrogenase involved in D-alanine esterification of teichoic acids
MYQSDLMAGRRILVTGGGTGLGRAMAERFLGLGADVAICGRRQAVVEETAAAWRERNSPAGASMPSASTSATRRAVEEMVAGALAQRAA